MVAVAGATSALEGWGLDEMALARASEAGERLVHGNPSGIDATTSAMGGVILFKRGEEPRRSRAADPGHAPRRLLREEEEHGQAGQRGSPG